MERPVEQNHNGRRISLYWLLIPVFLVAYPLSAGPASYLYNKGLLPEWVVWSIFVPLEWLALITPRGVIAWFEWYLMLWARP